MKSFRIAVIAACTLFFGAMPGLVHAAHVPGELLVKTDVFSSKTDVQAFESTLAEIGAKVTYEYQLVPGLKRVKMDPSRDLRFAIAHLSALKNVSYVTENFLRTPAVLRNARATAAKPKPDPAVPSPVDQPTTWVKDPNVWNNPGLSQNDTQKVWDKLKFYGDKSVVIAIIDTGVDYTHRDLVANMWRNPGEGAMPDGVDNDGDGLVDDIFGYDFANNDPLPYDDYGHGTHVAGIAAAVGGNGWGMAGQCPRCSIMALKFITAEGSGSDADAIRAMEYAVAHHADVLNCSWGGEESSPALEDAFRATSASGALIAVAAGNNGDDLNFHNFYPAKYQLPGMLSVAALRQTNIYIPFWSNYSNAFVQVSDAGDEISSTVPGNQFDTMSGTSMASPNIAGSMALIKARRPDLSATEIVELIRNHIFGDPDSMGKTVFHGRPDLYGLFKTL